MSILTRLASGVRTRELATRDLTPAPDGLSGVRAPIVGTANLAYTGRGLPQVPNWDARSAVEQGYLGSPAVYSAVRTIAETVAALPFRAGKDPTRPGEYDHNAPLARLLGPAPGGPNPTTSSRALWAWTVAQRIVTGRMGWELERAPRSKQIINVWPLVSQYLQPIPTVSAPGQARPTTYFAGYRYNLPDGFIDLPAANVFYSWRPSQSDWRQPETVMQAARIPISISIALGRYHWGMLNNGMAGRKMIITSPFAEPDHRRAFQEQFLAEMTGFDNAGKPAFAEATTDFDPSTGKASPPTVQVVDLAQTATDAQLMALMEYMERAIYKAFSVPESEIGDASQRTYSNAGEEYRVFWTRTIVPLLAEIADDINTYLAPQLGDEVGWFDLSGVEVLKPSSTFQPDTPTNLVKAGIVAPGEVREDLHLPYDLPAGPGENTPNPAPAVDDPDINPTTHSSTSRAAEPVQAAVQPVVVDVRHDVIARIDEIVARRESVKSGVRVENSPSDVGNTERLMAYWAEGKGAAKIGWGVDGDFDRCRVELGKYVGPKMVDGLCANLHHRATGAWPGHAPGESKPKARDAAVETESGTAGLFLPKAPTRLPKPVQAHVYRPSKTDRRKCGTCGKTVTATGHLHTARQAIPAVKTGKATVAAVAAVRHRGPHLPVKGGHANTPERARQAVRKMIDRHVTGVESQMTDVLRRLFADQAKATVSRMNGNRGKQMIKAALRAASDNNTPTGGATPAAGAAAAAGAGAAHEPTPLIDPAHIFDQAYWTDRTAQDVRSIMTAVGAWVPGHFATHTPGVSEVEDDSAAVQSVQDLLASATNRIAGQITQETFQQLTQALTDGVVAGDGYSGLATRVQQVFENADRVRAETISRTEVQSAVNGAQDSYAAALPAGVIGGREWLATPDSRTRPAHAEAEGQTRPMGEPFDVGGAELMFPGDPAGPPDEVINCRCVLVYLPAQRSTS